VRILGTDKERGLSIWDLAGREVQVFPDGILNNVDLRPSADSALAAATQRDDDTLAFYRIARDGTVARGEPFLHPAAPAQLAPEVDDVYGIAMAAGARGETFVVVNHNSGHVVQWQATDDAAGRLALSFARSFRLATQPEGMLAGDRGGWLCIGEEDAGVWRVPLDPRLPPEPEPVDRVGSPCLPSDDVEGLALWDRGALGRLLVVSAQGIDRAAVYDRDGGWPPPCVARLAVPAGAVDEVTETDGLEVTARPLPGFPEGMLVMMDDQDSGFASNFKLVDRAEVLRAMGR
jgi:3-phytase